MVPKISEERREARREQILTAAAACFTEQGLHHTTLQDIFRRSGLSAGAVYSYYPSREALLEAVFHRTLARNRRLLGQVPSGTPTEVERQVADGFSRMLDDSDTRELARLDIELFAHASRNETLRELLARSQRALVEAIAARIEDADDDPHVAARAILARLLGEMVLRCTETDRP